MFPLKFIFLLFLIFSALPVFSTEDEDFRIYKKPLLTGVDIAQTDTYTELLYKGEVIKKYVNTEFAIELLPHGADEEPDCYNSLTKDIASTRAKNIIGKDYLRSCLVLETKLIRNRFILFYGPSTDGSRVSIYDIRTKKFSHAVANNARDVRSNFRGDIFFFTRNVGMGCQRSIVQYKDGVSKKILDDCSLKQSGGPLIQIDSYRILPKKIIIKYTPYTTTVEGNIILDPKKKSSKTIQI